MSAWPLVPLGEIFEIARGGSPRPIDDYITDADDGVNWISIADASDSAKYIERTKRRIRPEGVARSRLVAPGDFLLTNSMSFGRPYIMRTSGCIHDGWLVLGKKREGIDQDFFYRLLGSDTVYAAFSRLAAGATVKNLNIDLVKGVEVPVPPIDEQRRIAAILDKADALRSQRRQALAELDKLAQVVFVELFGTLEAPTPGASVTALEDIVEPGRIVTYGIVQAGPHVQDGVPYIRTGDIKDGRILVDQLSRTSAAIAKDYSRSALKAGDIVMSIRATVGTTAVVPESLAGANLTQGTARISPGPSVDGTYLLHYLRTKSAQDWIQSQVKGATFREITLGRLRQLPVLLPNSERQREFSKRIQAIESVIANHRAALSESDALFASLQHRAFTGAL